VRDFEPSRSIVEALRGIDYLVASVTRPRSRGHQLITRDGRVLATIDEGFERGPRAARVAARLRARRGELGI
jgi:hypothetical protein